MKLNKIGFFQALGVFAYCSLAGYFMWNASKIFPDIKTFLGPVMFLLLFSTSILICGVLVFYKPYQLFFEGKRKEAADVVLTTAVTLAVILVSTLTLLILLK